MDETETLEILRSIKTAEDFKEKKDALMDSVEKLMNANLETLKKLQSSGLSKAELAPELTKFQQQWEAMGNEVEPEFNRLDTIPGIKEYGETLQKEFLKRMEPIAMEGEKIMMMLGVGGSKGETGRPPMPQYNASPTPPRKVIERQKLEEFETLYGINSIDELESSKDLIIKNMEDKLKDILQKVRSFKNMPKEEYQTEIMEINDYLDVFDNESQHEFERVKALSGGAEYYDKFLSEMTRRFGPIFDELDPLLNELSGPTQMPQYNTPPTRKSIERQKLDEFETLYGIKSIEELKNSKDLIIDTIENKVKDSVQKLQSFKNIPREEYDSEFKEISNYLDVFDNEFQSEFERIRVLPGGAVYIEEFQGELVNRMGSLLNEMELLLEELKKR